MKNLKRSQLYLLLSTLLISKSTKLQLILTSILLGGCVGNKHIRSMDILFSQFQPGHTMDPSYVEFAAEYIYLDNLSIRLVDLDQHGSYVPYLAKHFEFSEDKKTIDIELKDFYFSDGKKITSKDVINSFKRVILLGSPHSRPLEIFKGAKRLKSIDDDCEGLIEISATKLQIKTPQYVKELFYYFYLVDYSILHPDLVKKKKLLFQDWEHLVSGPYTLKWDEKQNLAFFKKNRFFNSNKNYNSPDIVKVYNRFNQEVVKTLIDQEKVDFGELHFNQFLSTYPLFKKSHNLQLLGNQIDSITFLILNTKSKIFKKVSTRNFVYKNIVNNFNLSFPELFSLKANQYFLPGAKGHLDNDFIEHLISSMKVQPPTEKALTITSFDTMKAIVPENIEKILSNALGINVVIDFSAKVKDNKKIKTERKFDAFLLTSSMSLKVLSETLNYAYNKDNPTFTDPTGNIALYLGRYLKNKNDHKYIELIIKQMILDSECIPLFYHMTPVFFNKSKFKMDTFNYQESIQFWKFDLI